MNKEKFNTYWKIGLLLAFIIGIVVVTTQLISFNRNGVACQSQPFIYGARIMADKYKEGHMVCKCDVTGKDVKKVYSFDETTENPTPKINLSKIYGGGLNEN